MFLIIILLQYLDFDDTIAQHPICCQ